MPAHIYLDHNATAPMLPEVADAVREAALRYGANPASQHEPGRQARRALETARESIGTLLGAQMTGRDADRAAVGAVVGPVLGVRASEVPDLALLLFGPVARGTEVRTSR